MPETHGVLHNSYNVNIKKRIKKKKDISMGEEQTKIFSVDISDVLCTVTFADRYLQASQSEALSKIQHVYVCVDARRKEEEMCTMC